MKHLFLFFVVGFAFQFTLSAQDFISPDKQWNVLASGMPLSVSTEIFWIEGDSLINDTLYHKIWVSRDSLHTRRFQGLLREASKVVYFIQPGNSEGVLYDFNAQIGDTVSIVNVFCFDAFPLIVYDIDTLEYYGTMRKQWHLGVEGEIRETWIEGIGSHSGPLYAAYEMCIVCPYWGLLCFHEQGELQYMMPYEEDCYKTSVGQNENFEASVLLIKPNPVKSGSSFIVESAFKLEEVSLFNSSGQLIRKIKPTMNNEITIETYPLKPGIYFITALTNGQHLSRKLLIE